MAESKPENLTLPKPEFRKTKLKIAKIINYDTITGRYKTLYPYILDADLISGFYIEYIRDSNKRPCRYRPWSFREEFLKYYEAYKPRFGCYDIRNRINKCPICKSPEYEDKEPKIYFNYDYKVPYCWGSLTYHMIKEHYFEPPSSFIRNILSLSNYKFLKLNINDLNLFQGLVNIGSTKPRFKYIAKQKEKIKEDINSEEEYGKKEKAFGEYNGYFITECENQMLCNVKDVIITNDQRAINEDDRGYKVYFPYIPYSEFKEKKYSFHTHPVYYDINYQFYYEGLPLLYPSEGDIDFFSEMKSSYNDEVEGHLIFANEGIYFITARDKTQAVQIFDKERDKLYSEKKDYIFEMRKKYYRLIRNKNDYYKMAHKDQYLIQEMNKVLARYNLRVVFYPRELTEKNKWIYGTIYLPYTIRKIEPEIKAEDDQINISKSESNIGFRDSNADMNSEENQDDDQINISKSESNVGIGNSDVGSASVSEEEQNENPESEKDGEDDYDDDWDQV